MKKLLIVCIDCLGYDLFTKKNAPFLYSFARKNHFAKLRTLIAGIPFSLYSGEYPDKHDTWLEFVYSPKTSPFKWQKYLFFLGRRILTYATLFFQYMGRRNSLAKLYNMPFKSMGRFDIASRKNIWDLEMFQGRNFVCYKWPLFVRNMKRSIIVKNETDRERCQRLIRSIDKDTGIYDMQLVGLDKTIHKHGISSQETSQKIRETDILIKELVASFREKIPGINVIIWSDHGAVPVKEYIDMKSMMPEEKGYTSFYYGTTASFWFENEKTKSTVLKRLSGLEFGRVLSPAERKRYRIPGSRKHGEIIFMMKPGHLIFPNYYQKSEKFRAMHYYAPDECSVDGIIISNMKIKRKTINLVDVKKLIEVS